MPKGMHTASAVILFRRAPTLQTLVETFGQREGAGVFPAEGGPGWMGEPGGVVLPLGAGRVVISAFDAPWPDGMGDPKDDPDLFGAWTYGFFGPFTWPGGLQRAVQHRYGWAEADRAVDAHGGFVRLVATQATGEDDPVLPEGYDPLAELREVTDLAREVAGLPGALAWFDPNGELLLDPAEIDDALGRNEIPLDLWSNVRMFRAAPGWTLMDTVGMGQLDRDDLEVVAPDAIDPNEVAGFLRSLADYLTRQGPVIRDGHTVDGPGGRWRAGGTDAAADPPRRVLRLVPDGRSDLPDGLSLPT